MNDKNKKKIYIGIIAACVLVTGYIVYTLSLGGGGGTPEVLPPAPNQVSQNAPRTATTARNTDPSLTEYTAPAVFPNDNKFQTQVLNSGKYQELTDYPRLTITSEEIGKEDLFAPF